jgi:hypothetical protein
LLRIDGQGAGALYACEAGTHRVRGLAQVDPCHVVVELIAMKTAFTDGEWMSAALAAAWPTSAPRGDARREHDDDRAVWIRGKSVKLDIPWRDYFARLEEIAISDLLNTIAEEEVELAELFKVTLEIPE